MHLPFSGYFLAHAQPYLCWQTPWVADDDRSPRGAKVENSRCIEVPHRGQDRGPAGSGDEVARSSAST